MHLAAASTSQGRKKIVPLLIRYGAKQLPNIIGLLPLHFVPPTERAIVQLLRQHNKVRLLAEVVLLGGGIGMIAIAVTGWFILTRRMK